MLAKVLCFSSKGLRFIRYSAFPFVISALQGCGHTPGKELTTPQWLSDFSHQKNNNELCRSPVGNYRVDGTSSDPDFNYALHQLLFEDKLAGFPVEQLQISASEDDTGIQIRGILAGVPLNQSISIVRQDGPCIQKWYLEVDTGAVNSQMRSEALLWTGGLILPASEVNHVYLGKAGDGALIVHVINRAWILGAFVVPFKIEKDVWLKFESVNSASGPPAGNQSEAARDEGQ